MQQQKLKINLQSACGTCKDGIDHEEQLERRGMNE